MAGPRAWTHQPAPALSRLKDEARANTEALERRVKTLEGKVARLELLATWTRVTLYNAILVAFALIPSAPPSEPPQ
jgi:hypothetical protein